MPFYKPPGEDAVFIEDVTIALGRMVAEGECKRFVSLMSSQHILGCDLEELDALMGDLHEARQELKRLMASDARRQELAVAGQSTDLGLATPPKSAKGDDRLN